MDGPFLTMASEEQESWQDVSESVKFGLTRKIHVKKFKMGIRKRVTIQALRSRPLKVQVLDSRELYTSRPERNQLLEISR